MKNELKVRSFLIRENGEITPIEDVPPDEWERFLERAATRVENELSAIFSRRAAEQRKEASRAAN